MQGASPLASPGLNPGGTGFSFGRRCPRGACPRGCRLALLCRYPRGAYLSPRLPTLPFVCRFSPIPPTPFPAGRGSFKVYFAGGFAPGTPATGWEAALAFPLEGGAPRGACPRGCRQALLCRYPRGGLIFRLACRPCLELTFLPPSPYPPSRREGGVSKFISPGASPPAPLRPGGKRHWLYFWKAVPQGGFAPCIPGQG